MNLMKGASQFRLIYAAPDTVYASPALKLQMPPTASCCGFLPRLKRLLAGACSPFLFSSGPFLGLMKTTNKQAGKSLVAINPSPRGSLLLQAEQSRVHTAERFLLIPVRFLLIHSTYPANPFPSPAVLEAGRRQPRLWANGVRRSRATSSPGTAPATA